MDHSLAGRVKALVHAVHGGNVNLAAKEIGVSQPTLARMVAGDVENPRMSALSKISAFYMASTDWLVSGRGETPAALREAVASGMSTHANVTVRWILSVRRLGLPREIEDLLESVPNHTSLVGFLFPTLLPADEATRKALNDAREHEHRAWLSILSAALLYRGEQGVREAFTAGKTALEALQPPVALVNEMARVSDAATEKKVAPKKRKRA